MIIAVIARVCDRARLESLAKLAATEMREQWLQLKEVMLKLGFDEPSALATAFELLRCPPVVDDSSPDPVEELLAVIKGRTSA
jgi:ferritin-like protein